MQPTWSGASPPSISESAMAGCHRSWLLKSRSTAQTRSIGASMMAERVTRSTGSPAPEISLQRIEAALEDALADVVGEAPLALQWRIELGRPLGKGAAAIGHRRQLQRCDIVADA